MIRAIVGTALLLLAELLIVIWTCDSSGIYKVIVDQYLLPSIFLSAKYWILIPLTYVDENLNLLFLFETFKLEAASVRFLIVRKILSCPTILDIRIEAWALRWERFQQNKIHIIPEMILIHAITILIQLCSLAIAIKIRWITLTPPLSFVLETTLLDALIVMKFWKKLLTIARSIHELASFVFAPINFTGVVFVYLRVKPSILQELDCENR